MSVKVDDVSGSPVSKRLSAEVARLVEQAEYDGVQLTGEGGLLPDMIKQAVEAALRGELTAHLGYERYAPEGRGSGNSRNGSTGKTVQTAAGPAEIAVPRDRAGTFEPVTIPKGARRFTEFDDMVIALYAKGLTTRDIAEWLEQPTARRSATRPWRTSPTASTSWSRRGGPGHWTRSTRSSHRRDPGPDP